ncbi:MAG: hypothetical protein FD156_346 [Nitrospirae bacterium]|nr:MAG: hypothetical protein FD156_346 [Nitrospirota bacterium]
MKLKLIGKFIFYFFGTFLHELSHYAAAFFMGKPEGFSLIPKIEGGSFIFGSVSYRVRYKVLSSFIASAPLLWWVVLVLMLLYFKLMQISGWIPHFNYSLIWQRLKSFSLSDAVFIWLFIQLLWAGRLSSKDIKNFFSGFFSVSGLVLIAITALSIYFLNTFPGNELMP